jgi:hypothetical protein
MRKNMTKATEYGDAEITALSFMIIRGRLHTDTLKVDFHCREETALLNCSLMEEKTAPSLENERGANGRIAMTKVL